MANNPDNTELPKPTHQYNPPGRVAKVEISLIFKAVAPKTMGQANKNENLVALSRLKPTRRPEAIVIPERETPGIMAKD